MIKHYTNGVEYMSVDTEKKYFTLHRHYPENDYEMIPSTQFDEMVQKMVRSNDWRMKWDDRRYKKRNRYDYLSPEIPTRYNSRYGKHTRVC